MKLLEINIVARSLAGLSSNLNIVLETMVFSSFSSSSSVGDSEKKAISLPEIKAEPINKPIRIKTELMSPTTEILKRIN